MNYLISSKTVFLRFVIEYMVCLITHCSYRVPDKRNLKKEGKVYFNTLLKGMFHHGGKVMSETGESCLLFVCSQESEMG